MARDRRFMFLKNEQGTKDKFNKQRGYPQPPQEEEAETEKIPTPAHQERLFTASRILAVDRRQRRQAKTIPVPSQIEIIQIHFYTRFNRDLETKFLRLYGLKVISYEDFNKTVLFSIDDEDLFNVFRGHINDFYNSANDLTYANQPYALIALIHNFYFLNSERRKLSFGNNICSFSLIPFLDQRASRIFESLQDYLREKGKSFTNDAYRSNIEITNLSNAEIQTIVDNFDIVRSVTSARPANIRPGSYGQPIREYGFTVLADDENVTVAVIDTGVEAIEPLGPLLAGIEIDLTGLDAPYWDENGHGTMVAGLVALGSEFLELRKEIYPGKAKIAVIKVMQSGNDSYSINRLIGTIRAFRRDHGIRFFNLSLNDPIPKKYNSTFSDYAYQLDKLAFDLDILIFISAGNMQPERVTELTETEHPSHIYPFHFYCLNRPSEIHRCESTNICSPAESLNNLTIGALAENFESNYTEGITPAKELPSYFTRKFHFDYNQDLNGTAFLRAQKNKHLNKPDIVYFGGDFPQDSAGIDILTSPRAINDRFYSKASGTSVATPLVASMAAQIAKLYSALNTQSIKAIILNSCELKCSEQPVLFRHSTLRKLLPKLTGNGTPVSDYLLYNSENEITLLLEETIELEEIRAIKIDLPKSVSINQNKLEFTATLCYSFDPIRENHLNYNPLQIVFGFFRNVSVEQLANGKVENYKIPKGSSWSDDIWPTESRLYSNVQYLHFYLNPEKLDLIENSLTLAIRCTGKKEIDHVHRQNLENNRHSFSLVININEIPEARASGELYDEMVALNTLENIIAGDLDADLDLTS